MAEFQRIISLVPSLTELLVDFGLKDRIAGRTRFCVHPAEAVEEIPIIGGTKNPRLEKIREMNPDYILANREENRKEDIRELETDFQVTVTDISTIEDALITIHELGDEFGVPGKAKKLIDTITKLLEKRPEEPPMDVAYFIWRDPWMTVGRDTYIHDVLKHWNLHNVFRDRTRYPKINLHAVQARNPDLILLSSEPYPFKEKHLPEIEDFFPDTRILLADGEWFSWYGSRMAHAFERLNVWRKAIA